jgi:hypothetical protein
MFGNLLFGLTTLTYIALTIFNLQKVNATGDRLVGWGIIAFVILAFYVVFSLSLTISIAAKGGFNWLSNSESLRNTAIGMLWLGMVAGVVFCTMIRPEWNTDPSTGVVRWLSFPVYFGATWLPLLMLFPYAILLNAEWRDTYLPSLYKIPLVTGGAFGLLIVMAPTIIMTLGIKIPQKEIDISEVPFKNAMNTLNGETSIKELLKFSLDNDERVRIAALAKIKADQDWEGELIRILEDNGEYSYYSYYWVYVFLNINKVDHPERFIKPINNTIPAITLGIQEILKKSFRETSSFTYLNVDALCRVLDTQFKDSSAAFRPNMLKLQTVIESPHVKREGDIDTPEFVKMRNKYQLAVKNWLDSH